MQKLDMVSYHCNMPILENIHVQLSEVLEVRGAPLAEHELWVVLSLTVDAVQDLFLRGSAFKDGVATSLPTPDTLQCTSSGRILISNTPNDTVEHSSLEAITSNLAHSEEELGKVYVYALGKTLQYAAESQSDFLQQSNQLSPYLCNVLTLMQQEQARLRISLQELAQMCSSYVGKVYKDLSMTDVVVQLHQEVLGNLPEDDILRQVDQDFKEENSRISFSVSNNDPYTHPSHEPPPNLSDRIYGHRLGYQSNSSSSTGSKFHPLERWKRALSQITSNRKQMNSSCPSSLEGCRAQTSSSRVYQELAERRRMVELLRMNVDVGQSAVKVNNKGLKPKTLAELVLLLKNNPTKTEPAITSTAERRLSDPSFRWSPNSLDELSRTVSWRGPASTEERTFYSKQMKTVGTSSSHSKAQVLPGGPEFILNSINSPRPLNLCFKKKFQDEAVSSMCRLRIVLLTGEQLEVTCEKSISATTLFHAVAHHIALLEHYLFGLAVNRDNEYLFLDGRQRLQQVVTSLMMVPEDAPLTLFLRVKFYLSDLNLIKHQATKHLFYLQTRQDVLSHRTRCGRDASLVLSGLALQAEFGDQGSREDYFLPRHYLPMMHLQATAEAGQILVDQHLRNAGISIDLAELQFIQGVRDLEEYGYHFHLVWQDKHNPTSCVWLGISSQGVDVFDEKGSERHRCQSYLWMNIQKLSFTKKSFNISPKTTSLTGRSVKYTFHTFGPFKSRYLFNMAVGHHQFFVKLKSGAYASEIIMEDIDLENGIPRNILNDTTTTASDTDEEIECTLNSISNNSNSWLASLRNKYLDSLPTMDSFTIRKRPPDLDQLVERCSSFFTSKASSSSITKQNTFSSTRDVLEDKVNEFGHVPSCPSSIKDAGIDDAQSWNVLSNCTGDDELESLGRCGTPESIGSEQDLSGSRIVIKPLPLTAYQRRVLSGAVDPTRPVSDNTMAGTYHADMASQESDVNGNLKNGVTRHCVALERDSQLGYGLVLTCGNTFVAGTYVESVQEGSRAHGTVLTGDKVISLNGQSVEDRNYLEVVEILQSLHGLAVLGLQRASPSVEYGKLSGVTDCRAVSSPGATDGLAQTVGPGLESTIEGYERRLNQASFSCQDQEDYSSLEERSLYCKYIPESNETMDTSVFDEGEGPPKPRPRRKKSQKCQTCHSPDGQSDRTPLHPGSENSTLNESVALNSGDPQVNLATRLSPEPKVAAQDETLDNRQAASVTGASRNASTVVEKDMSSVDVERWSPEDTKDWTSDMPRLTLSVLKGIPNAPSSVVGASAQRMVYSWNLNRRSVSPECVEDSDVKCVGDEQLRTAYRSWNPNRRSDGLSVDSSSSVEDNFEPIAPETCVSVLHSIDLSTPAKFKVPGDCSSTESSLAVDVNSEYTERTFPGNSVIMVNDVGTRKAFSGNDGKVKLVNGDAEDWTDLRTEIMRSEALPFCDGARSKWDVNEDVCNSVEVLNASRDHISTFSVVLTKQEGSFGFRVTERYEFSGVYERGIFVHSLIPEGAAETDGTIQAGDKLVRINGRETEALSYQESVALLKKCPVTSELHFRRPPADASSDSVSEAVRESNGVLNEGQRDEFEETKSVAEFSEGHRHVSESKSGNRHISEQKSNRESEFGDYHISEQKSNRESEFGDYHISESKPNREFSEGHHISEPKLNLESEFSEGHRHISELVGVNIRTVDNTEFWKRQSEPNVVCDRESSDMIAKWGRRGSRTSLGSVASESGESSHGDGGKPIYGRSISQTNLRPPIQLPVCGEYQRSRSNSVGEQNVSLPRVLNGVLRISPDLSPDHCNTFPRKSKSESPSVCDDTLSDDVFQSSGSLESPSQAPSRHVRSESAPLLFVPKTHSPRNCNSPSSPHLGSVPEGQSLDRFDGPFLAEKLRNRPQANASSHSALELETVNARFQEAGVKAKENEEGESDQPERRKKRAGLLDKPEDVLKYLTSSNTFDVYLQKTSRGLGIGIFGGSDLHHLGPVCQLIRVRKLYPLQSALETGKIAVGDVILQVNGQSTVGLKHTEALELLRVAPADVCLKIYRPNPAVMPPVSFFIKEVSPNSSFLISPPGSACNTLSRPKTLNFQEYEACLMKKEGSLGFSIIRYERQPSDDSHPTGIYVKALVREPALSHGRMAPGDRILMVNGVDISEMSHPEAVSFLRSTSDKVTLRLSSNTDPLWPQCLEDDIVKPVKPLRKEAVDMLSNRAKMKEGKTSPRRLRQRRNGSESHSSGDDTVDSPERNIVGIQITPESPVFEESGVETPSEHGVGLVRSLRPKSLDGLSFNEKKPSTGGAERTEADLLFHRQGSVAQPASKDVGSEGAGLLKWRGATLHSGADNASQSSGSIDLSGPQVSRSDGDSSPVPVPPQRIHSLPCEDEAPPKRNGHLVSEKSQVPQVVKVYIELDRGWYGRLGFSLSDVLPGEIPNPLSNYTSPVVRAVHPGSVAQRDGRVRVGDRLVMVNGESMVDRPASEVIDILRKTRGKMRMDFLRVQKDCDATSLSSDCS